MALTHFKLYNTINPVNMYIRMNENTLIENVTIIPECEVE